MKVDETSCPSVSIEIHNPSSTCCDQTNNFARITGKILFVSGVAGLILSNTLPVVVPATATAVVAIPTFLITYFLSDADQSKCVNGLAFALLTGGGYRNNDYSLHMEYYG